MRALIVGGPAERGSLAAARGLARAGWTVGVGSPGAVGFAASSRMTVFRHDVPSPVDGLERFTLAVRRAIVAGGYDVVFAGGDAEMLALSVARTELPAAVPWCRHQSLLLTVDKVQLAGLASSAGLRAPRTTEATPEALRRLGDGPVVVKPRVPVVEGKHRLFETIVVSGRAEAKRRADRLRSKGFVPLLQEQVSGHLVALNLVIGRRGEVLARVQQRADRLHPPRAGVSVRAETVPVDERLAEKARRLLLEVEWFGLAQLQLLQPIGGQASLVDLNGRFYGSLALSLAAGANLPALWGAAATGAPVTPVADARAGVRYQWFGGEMANARSGGSGARLRALASGARYGAGATHSVWARDDPGPALRALASNVRRRMNGQ
jgi:predicted ATP-grasp superfamily ATP-dependent carboligase